MTEVLGCFDSPLLKKCIFWPRLYISHETFKQTKNTSIYLNINQLDALNFIMRYFTYRCDDTRDCIVQF